LIKLQPFKNIKIINTKRVRNLFTHFGDVFIEDTRSENYYNASVDIDGNNITIDFSCINKDGN